MQRAHQEREKALAKAKASVHRVIGSDAVVSPGCGGQTARRQHRGDGQFMQVHAEQEVAPL